MINYLVTILLAICGVHGTADNTIAAELGQFNYFVMVWYRDEFRCGGTIIDEKHIITRGTCVMNMPSSDLSIIAGTIDTRYSKKPQFSVRSIHIHYGFKPIHGQIESDETHWVHDIAVLKLASRMVWNELMAPAVLITGEYDWNVQFNCVVPGWRHTYRDKVNERFYVRWIDATSYTDEKCRILGVRLLRNEKCAFWSKLYRMDTYHYYNGSPIVYGDTVVGMVDGRIRKDHHAYLNFLPYRDFIANAVDVRKDDVSPGEITYVVSIWDRGSFKCGGIILDTSYILTTGYCVENANQTNLQVIAGQTQVLRNEPQIRWLSVESIAIHPDYEEIINVDGPKSLQIKNNYALLKLAAPLEWSQTISVAPLPNHHSMFTDRLCRALRWYDAYTVDDRMLLQLVWSEEYIVDPEVCEAAGVNVEADEICISTLNGPHPRNLDSSGNPVVCEGIVIGIIIPNFSSVPQSCFTNVLSIWSFMKFMDEVHFEHRI